MKNWAVAECGSVRARHRDRADVVLEAVPASFAIGSARRLLLHVRVEAAALDHEAVDDAVENGAVVVIVLHVLEEVLDGLRRLIGIQLEDDHAAVGLELDRGSAASAG